MTSQTDSYQEDDQDVGRALKQLRESANLTQDQVAKRMRTTKGSVCRMEKNGAEPRIGTVMRYARACGFQVRFDELKAS